MRAWYAPRAAAELLHFRALVDEVASADVLRVILARAARSARRTTHFDLDFPREPQVDPYWCHKHRRTCRPVEEARRFLLRYTTGHARPDRDVRGGQSGQDAHASVRHGDARELDLGGPFDGVVTSPPYPGLIDYHEQHRYAYELLGLDERRESRARTAGAGRRPARRSRPTSRASPPCSRTRESGSRPAPRCASSSTTGATSTPKILRRAGLRLDDRLERHVNRRTGRRAGEYFESVLVCRAS